MDDQFAALGGVFDEELMQLKLEYDTISMKNAINFHYLEAFKKEAARATTVSPNSNASKTRQKAESFLSMLDKLTDLHLDQVCSRTVNEEQVDIERDLLLTYQERKGELVKLHKSFSEAVKKQQTSGLKAEIQQVAAILDAAREKLAQNKKLCAELQAEVEAKEKFNQETIEFELKELAKVKKELETYQAELNNKDEDVLNEEIASLTAQFKSNRQLLKEWDDDDDSSIYSDDESEAGTVTPTKIPEVDFDSFFKNPNDFPNLKPTSKQVATKVSPNATINIKLGTKPKFLTSPEKQFSASFASVLKNDPKSLRSKEKFIEYMRKKRLPKMLKTPFKESPPVSIEPPKKVIRRSTPMPHASKQSDPEVQTSSEVVAQPAPKEVVLKPRALIFEMNEVDNENQREAETEKDQQTMEQPMETEDSAQLSQSSSEGGKDEEVEKDVEIINDAETGALMQGTVVMSKAVAVENGQFVFEQPTASVSPTGSECFLFGDDSEMNTSRVSGNPEKNVFEESFPDGETDPKADGAGGDFSFGSNSNDGSFEFFGQDSKKSETRGFFDC